MKKGYIEAIEENTVLVIFTDNTKIVYPIDIFPLEVKVDMEVIFAANKLIEVRPASAQLKKEIQEITQNLFVPFTSRKKTK